MSTPIPDAISLTGNPTLLKRQPGMLSARRSNPSQHDRAGATGIGAWCGDVDLAAPAALIGDPTRAAMLSALLDGRSRSAGDLGRLAGVAASTASGHLARLLQGGLVTCEARGRERRYRLASIEAAEAVETLARLAPPAKISSLRAAERGQALRSARLCYDHLAGRLGVGITDALVACGAIVPFDSVYSLTLDGEMLLKRWGVDVAAARAGRRSFTRACLDWSERRPHLAGALGAALAEALIGNRWLRRRAHDRGLTVTDGGRLALRRELSIPLD